MNGTGIEENGRAFLLFFFSFFSFFLFFSFFFSSFSLAQSESFRGKMCLRVFCISSNAKDKQWTGSHM